MATVTFDTEASAQEFEQGLRAYLGGQEKLSAQEKRLKRLLDKPDSPRRRRALSRAEGLVRGELHADGNTAINWGAIDWKSLLAKLLPLLLQILTSLLG